MTTHNGKVRVHELAKKYDMNNKDFIDLIKQIGVETSSHLSGLSEEDEKKIVDHFENKNKKTEEVKAEKKPVQTNQKPVAPIKTEAKVESKPVTAQAKPAAQPEAPKKVENNKKSAPKKPAKPHVQGIDAGDIKGGFVPFKDSIGPKKDNKKPSYNDSKKNEPKEESDIKVVAIREELPLKEFAEMIKINPAEIIKKLFLKGHMVTLNSFIPFELAEEIALGYDILCEKYVEVEVEYGEKYNLEVQDNPEEMEERAAIITIMGHVDHGKTSLLDAIRETSVVTGEAGGITQKIGAYQIERSGKKITFIDTPGHEAFTEMRARGAKVTDIAVLVVAADDGVMPQTVEAISHAKAADVPIIVAINKIDKPDANPMRVKQELMEHGLVSVEWGGPTEFVEVSAKKRLNLDNLLDVILISAELLELTANANKRAKGVVIESKLDVKMGAVADILIQEGTLSVGDIFVSGATYGRVRAMVNDKGKKIRDAGPSTPIEIIGFSKVPEAGDMFYVVENEKLAKKIVEDIDNKQRLDEQKQKKHMTLDDLHTKLERDKLKEIKLIIKADSKGSVEALKESLNKLAHEEVKVNILHSSSGAITEGDVKLAEASDAIIIGFAVRPTTKALIEAEKENVEIRNYNVIYHVTEDIEKAIKGMLAPIFKEVYQGRAEIKQVFKITKLGNIAGCVVVDGKVRRDSKVRILRNGIIICDGKLSSLKRFANDASEATAGQECGMGIEDFNDLKEGDLIEAYVIEEIKRD